MSYFFDLQHSGVVEDARLKVITLSQGVQEQGSAVLFTLGLDEAGLIAKTAFKAYGSPYLLVGMEWLCRRLEGQSKESLPQSVYPNLMDQFAIPSTQASTAIKIEQLYKELVSLLKE